MIRAHHIALDVPPIPLYRQALRVNRISFGVLMVSAHIRVPIQLRAVNVRLKKLLARHDHEIDVIKQIWQSPVGNSRVTY